MSWREEMEEMEEFAHRVGNQNANLRAQVAKLERGLNDAIRQRIAALTEEQLMEFYRSTFMTRGKLEDVLRAALVALLAPEAPHA